MKPAVLVSTISFFFLSVAFGQEQEPYPRPLVIDTAATKALEAAMEKNQEKRQKIAKALIALGTDKKEHPNRRYKFIILLGKVRNKESEDFLIGNISLKLIGKDENGKDAKLFPCTDSLIAAKDWNSVRDILESLEKPKAQEDLVQFTRVIEGIIGKNLALKLVERHLHLTSFSVSDKNENLKKMKEIMAKKK